MINKVNIKSQQEVKKQFYHHFFKQINIQHIFFFLAFIIYGIGDGVTGAILMNTKGIYAESNLFFRFLYETFGLMAFITIKVLLTFILLLVAFIIYKLSNGHNYWMINGWLAALSIGGIMAVHANLRAVIGLPYPNPNSIIFLYIILTFIFVETGVYIDRKNNVITHCKNLCVYRPCRLSHLRTRMHLYLIKISSKSRLKIGTLRYRQRLFASPDGIDTRFEIWCGFSILTRYFFGLKKFFVVVNFTKKKVEKLLEVSKNTAVLNVEAEICLDCRERLY